MLAQENKPSKRTPEEAAEGICMPRCLKGSLSESNSDRGDGDSPFALMQMREIQQETSKWDRGCCCSQHHITCLLRALVLHWTWNGPCSGLRTRHEEEIPEHLETTRISLYLKPLQVSFICQLEVNLLASHSNWQGQERRGQNVSWGTLGIKEEHLSLHEPTLQQRQQVVFWTAPFYLFLCWDLTVMFLHPPAPWLPHRWSCKAGLF